MSVATPPLRRPAEIGNLRYFCTYFDHNYQAQGLAMYWSLRRWCPEAKLIILTLSRQAEDNLTAMCLPGVTIIGLDQFEGFDPALLAAKAGRSKIEYIFTCTPCLCRYVFRHFQEVELLTYLDADIYFYSHAEPLFEELGGASIGIIEHGYTSRRYLAFGRFNVGWISFRRDSQGLACIDWWREKCLEWCRDVVEPTRYADQKYLDQWPTLFSNVHILTHPGANLARWNIGNRTLSQADGRILVNDRPLIFFHFASFRQVSPHLYQLNFATHWAMPSRLMKREVAGRYIAELYAIAGPILPQGYRQLKLQDIGLRSLPNLIGQLLRVARSILLLDYVVIPDVHRHTLKLARQLALPEAKAAIEARTPVQLPTTWFIFADTPGFSGQKEASRLIYESECRTHIVVHLIRMPALNRGRHVLANMMGYLGTGIQALVGVAEAAISPQPILHLSLGQTKAALLRDAIPLFLIMGLRRKKAAIVSLNGHNFMEWGHDSYEANWLRLIMTQAEKLTVVGPAQRTNAIRLGIPDSKVMVVYNTCDTTGISATQIEAKHSAKDGPFRLLHLSNLIDSKGYPAYLEALELLSRQSGRKIEALLCGNVILSNYGARFRSIAAATAWIQDKIDTINISGRIEVRWIPGVSGEAKWQLYREAHAFVFPSLYKVEAQPLVLLESMAHGCAVISSNVGEISSLLDEECAILLDTPSAEAVAEAIQTLVDGQEKVRAMALAAKRLYEERFSPKIYSKTWDGILRSVAKG